MEIIGIWIAIRTLFSAGTYLFGLGTSIYAMVDFTEQFIHYKTICTVSCPNFSCGDLSYPCLRAFNARKYIIIGSVILFFAHTLNALMFALKFDKQHAPFKSAYFLPLLQFWRLLNLLKESWSFNGLTDFQMEEKNTLFTQLGLSIETFPMYDLQQFAWIYSLKHYVQGSLMLESIEALPISTTSSFLASLILGGLTVQATAKNAVSVRTKIAMGIFSGLFVSASAYLRCSSLLYLFYYKGVKASIQIYQGKDNHANILAYSYLNAFLANIKVAPYLLFYFILLSSRKVTPKAPSRIMKAFALAYISMNVGPLYPLVSEALEQNQLGTSSFRIKMLLVAFANFILDCLITPQPLHFVSHIDFALCIGVYVISIAIYVILDKKCGKMHSESTIGV